MGIEIGFIISAFVAGLLMFLAPCTLPLVPAYLGFISGVNTADLAHPEKARSARRRIILNGFFFILGFTLVFVLFGALAGLVGQSLVPFRIVLMQIGGVLVIFFGLFMLGVFKFPFLRAEHRLKAPTWLGIGKPSTSFAIGSAFAFGWTPCVGPILASILLLASTSATVFQGAFLLLIFSIGLALPFLLVALLYSRATQYIARMARGLRVIEIIGGIFLVVLGILLATGNFGLTIEYGYRIFDFIEYDRLLEYL